MNYYKYCYLQKAINIIYNCSKDSEILISIILISFVFLLNVQNSTENVFA